jgi:hypothetical protein
LGSNTRVATVHQARFLSAAPQRDEDFRPLNLAVLFIAFARAGLLGGSRGSTAQGADTPDAGTELDKAVSQKVPWWLLQLQSKKDQGMFSPPRPARPELLCHRSAPTAFDGLALMPCSVKSLVRAVETAWSRSSNAATQQKQTNKPNGAPVMGRLP